MVVPFEEAYHCDSITLNVTNNCNLNCTYCFEHYKDTQNMPSQIAIDAIDKAYNPVHHSNGEKFTINFFGGEPLLNWTCIKDLIDHCKQKDYEISYGITTNLTGLTDEMIEYFDDVSMYLLVSCDGIKEVHNKNRCNSWDRVINNLLRLKEAGLLMFVEARMTILPEDVKYAMVGVNMFVEMGIDNICPMPVVDVHWSKQHLMELEQFYMDLNAYYVDLMNKDWDRNISIKNTDDVLRNVMCSDIDDPLMCPIGSDQWCTIDWKGDVYPCHQLPTSSEEVRQDQKLGNIYTGVDRDLLILTPEQKRKARYPKEQCKHCIGKAICKTGCPEENLRMTGDMYTPSDDVCNTSIALVRAVKRFQNKLLHASNIRSRSINMIKENLQIKQYIDQLNSDVAQNKLNRLTSIARLMHVKELISNLGEENILPTFREYYKRTLIDLSAAILTNNNISVEQLKKVVEKEI